MAESGTPVAAYRLQLQCTFPFQDARKLAPYLHALGVSDLYASPLFTAQRGSAHGYDVTDPTRINPELGGAAEFHALVRALRKQGMGLLQDIVPNHMAASTQNPWWRDVLEYGRYSPYARYFDIEWDAPEANGSLLLPILGSPYPELLERGELSLALDEDGFYAAYGEHHLPLSPRSYAAVLSQAGLSHSAALAGLTQRLRAAPHRRSAQEALKDETLRTLRDTPTLLDAVAAALAKVNTARDVAFFDKLLSEQHYRLGYWKLSRERGNYRRFFDVNGLAGIRVEDPTVFKATHRLLLQLVQQGEVTGIRIDHIDGLRDPLGYLQALAAQTTRGGRPTYTLVEKILCGDEALRTGWPVSGTSGYEFLNAVNRVFVDGEGTERLRQAFSLATGMPVEFQEVVYQKKLQVLDLLFLREIKTLLTELLALASGHPLGRDNPRGDLWQALNQTTACLPVYRTYTNSPSIAPEDRVILERTFAAVREHSLRLNPNALAFLQRVLSLDYGADASEEVRTQWLAFVQQWQQITGPVMAKRLEDTALYLYNPLISLNDVGGDPAQSAGAVVAFHRFNQERLATWPHH